MTITCKNVNWRQDYQNVIWDVWGSWSCSAQTVHMKHLWPYGDAPLWKCGSPVISIWRIARHSHPAHTHTHTHTLNGGGNLTNSFAHMAINRLCACTNGRQIGFAKGETRLSSGREAHDCCSLKEQKILELESNRNWGVPLFYAFASWCTTSHNLIGQEEVSSHSSLDWGRLTSALSGIGNKKTTPQCHDGSQVVCINLM